jgi:hypothetical protein
VVKREIRSSDSSDPRFSVGEEPPVIVTLSPDYAVGGPLWPRGESTDALVPAELMDRLTSWQMDFEDNFVPESGWISDQARTRWAEVAVIVERDLRGALAGVAEVEVDLWPLQDEDDDGDSIGPAGST